MQKIKIGIIICDRYHTCAGGKCFRSLQNKEGAFEMYKDKEVELAAFTTCGGCPGGNIEYAPEEMKKNGVTHDLSWFIDRLPRNFYHNYRFSMALGFPFCAVY